MAETEDSFSISRVVGFGFYGSARPDVDDKGRQTMTYRYLPPAMWYPELDWIPNKINQVARVFSRYEDVPKDLLLDSPTGDIEPLSEAGRVLLESCPVYASILIDDNWFYWSQYDPDGEESYQLRTNDPMTALNLALRQSPIDEWATMFLSPWSAYLQSDPLGSPTAILMDLPKSQPTVAAGPTSAKESNNSPVVSAKERVENPHGVYKVLLISCSVEHQQQVKDRDWGEGMEVLPCAMALRNDREGLFDWKEHYVFKFTGAIQFLPACIKWAVENGVRHPGGWSVATFAPCYQWRDHHVMFDLSREPQWDRLCIIFDPLESLDAAQLARYEHELASLTPPERCN